MMYTILLRYCATFILLSTALSAITGKDVIEELPSAEEAFQGMLYSPKDQNEIVDNDQQLHSSWKLEHLLYRNKRQSQLENGMPEKERSFEVIIDSTSIRLRNGVKVEDNELKSHPDDIIVRFNWKPQHGTKTTKNESIMVTPVSTVILPKDKDEVVTNELERDPSEKLDDVITTYNWEPQHETETTTTGVTNADVLNGVELDEMAGKHFDSKMGDCIDKTGLLQHIKVHCHFQKNSNKSQHDGRETHGAVTFTFCWIHNVTSDSFDSFEPHVEKLGWMCVGEFSIFPEKYDYDGICKCARPEKPTDQWTSPMTFSKADKL